jgi:pre-mRNA-processing factor 19
MNLKRPDLEDSTSLQKPRMRGAMSVPGIMMLFQNEWDSTILEISDLKKQLDDAHKELINAVYQNEASLRVVSRMTKERDDSINALKNLETPKTAVPQEFVYDVLSNAEISAQVLLKISEKQTDLRNVRKGRKIPDNWPSQSDFSMYTASSVSKLPSI